jgi:hypothetical protein
MTVFQKWQEALSIQKLGSTENKKGFQFETLCFLVEKQPDIEIE